MSPQARWEYMKTVHARYRKAKTRLDKGRILDEFCRTYDCHRKHALRLLNAPTPADERPPDQGVFEAGGRASTSITFSSKPPAVETMASWSA
jgi:hypothetical protein